MAATPTPRRWFAAAAILFAAFEGNLLYQYAYRSENLLHARPAVVLGRGSARVRRRALPYDYDAMLAHGGEVGRHVFPFLYPPSSLLALYPLKLITWPAAAMLVAAAEPPARSRLHRPRAGLVAPAGRRAGADRLGVFLGASLLTGLPVVNTLVHGQSNLLVLFLLCSTWLCLRHDRHRAAGAALAFAILVKPSPAIFLLYLAARRSWRALGACVATLAAAAAATLALLPSGLWQTWLLEVRPSLGYGRQPLHLFSPACPSNQSLNALVSRFFLEPACQPIDAPLPIAGRALAYTLAIAVLVLSLYAVTSSASSGPRRRRSKRHDLGFCLFLATMFLVGSLSWEHHLVFAMPGLALLVLSALRQPRGAGELVGLAACVPASWSRCRSITRRSFTAGLRPWSRSAPTR